MGISKPIDDVIFDFKHIIRGGTSMLTQMVTETLLGALTGYVTNHTAIRSLFQPGGVIEKTRDDFAREAGRLLEDQVLTRVVLARQLALPAGVYVLRVASMAQKVLVR